MLLSQSLSFCKAANRVEDFKATHRCLVNSELFKIDLESFVFHNELFLHLFDEAVNTSFFLFNFIGWCWLIKDIKVTVELKLIL